MGTSFQTIFVGNLLLLLMAMKGVSFKLAGANLKPSWWWSPKLWPHYQGQSPALVELLVRQIFYFYCSVLCWWGLTHLPEAFAAYGGFALVWFSTEWIGATFSLLFSSRGLPLIHNEPWKAKHLMEFWSARWNVWISRWLTGISRRLYPRRPAWQLWGSFFLSGLFHEAMFALPFWLAFNENHFGLMLTYFLLQALGVQLERTLQLKHSSPLLARLWCWLWVLLPMPLFTSGAFLTLFKGGTP
jgi:hypothetical protein